MNDTPDVTDVTDVPSLTDDAVVPEPIEGITIRDPSHIEKDYFTQDRELLESQYGAIGSLNRKTHAEQYYFPAVEDAPTWGESALWSMEEMSVTRNIMAWTGWSIEKSRREAFDDEEIEEEAARIEANLPDLLYGIVGDDARMAIQFAPTLKEAQRQSTWIRKQQQRIAAREHEPWFQAMVGGVAGFVLDPTNLVPGMALAKTGTMAMRTAMAARAMSKAGHKTQLAARVGGWSALGTTEELVRNIPRAQVDAMYSMDQYIMDAVFAGAFGGALPMLAPTFRVAGRGIGATAGLVADAGHALGADVAFRTAANMTRRASKAHPERAADVPPPPVTVGDKVRAAKAAATRTVAERLRSFRRYKADAPIREGVAAGAGDAIDEANDTFLRTLIDDLRQVVADPDNPAPRVYGTVDEELAAIKNTGRPDEAPTPHTPTGDVEADKIANVRHAARTAQTAARQTHERAARLIDESNMSPEAKAKAHMVNDINRNNNMRAIDDGLSNVGLRPVRTRLNNATHTDVLAPLVGNLRKAMNSATSVLEKTVGEIGMNVPQDLRRRLNATLSRALMVGGASRDGVDASFKDAFVRHFKNKDHKSRQEFARQTGVEFQRNFGELVEEIMDEVTDPDMMDGLLAELELIRDAVSAELHILEQFAKNPFEDMTAIPTEWAMTFNDFGNSVDTAELSSQFVESKLQSALKHQYWTLTNSLSSRLIRSEVPGAQWFALNILETPSGFGGKIDRSMTASILSETLNNIHSLPVLEAWEAALSARALRLGWGVGKRIRNYSASAKTHEDIDAFSREVLEYVNSKKFGHVSREVAPEVREFGDTLLDTYSGLHDLQVGWVDGINAANKRQHYIHQQWDDGAILDLLATPGGRKGLEDLFQQGYTNAGLTPADAAVVAKAMVDQKIAVSNKTRVGTGVIGDEQVAGNMPDLLWTLQAAAKRGDTDESTVWRIVEMLNDNGADGRPGYAKSRVDIDYNASVLIDGKTVSVMDLLDRDLPATFLRYTKEATARRAISESSGKQLNSDEAMNRMLIAVNRQGSEMGRPVNTRDMQNALMMMMGRQYDGQLPLDLRRARDAISLAGMGGLGESQLAEFGLAINRGTAGVLGLVQTARSRAGRRKGLRGVELTPEQQADTGFLRELQQLSGLMQEMYLVHRPNVHFDAQNVETGALSKFVDTATGGKYRPLLQKLQTRWTGYGMVRAWEDQIAMASLTNDLAKFFDDGSSFTSNERWRDLGVSEEMQGWLAGKFKDARRADDGRITSLRIEDWSQSERHQFGVVLNRHASQVVQKAFVGELSPEMANPTVAFLMQFKNYPMLAAEKQQARNLKFADKEAAAGIMLNTVSSAQARIIRAYSVAAAKPESEREAYLEKKLDPGQLGYDTLLYMGIAGMLPEVGKLASTTMGFNNYYGGIYRSPADMIPALSYADKYSKAVGSVTGVPFDGLDDADVRNVQVATPLGTTGFLNLISGVIAEAAQDD